MIVFIFSIYAYCAEMYFFFFFVKDLYIFKYELGVFRFHLDA